MVVMINKNLHCVTCGAFSRYKTFMWSRYHDILYEILQTKKVLIFVVDLCLLWALAHALLSAKAIAAEHSGYLNPHATKQWNNFLHNGTALALLPNSLVTALPPFQPCMTGESTVPVQSRCVFLEGSVPSGGKWERRLVSVSAPPSQDDPEQRPAGCTSSED